MQAMMSGKRATMSLLLIVMLATIFLSAIFLVVKFLSFRPPLLSSSRSSATLPCEVFGKYAGGGMYAINIVAVVEEFAGVVSWSGEALAACKQGVVLEAKTVI